MEIDERANMLKVRLIRFGKKLGWVLGLDIRRTNSPEFNYMWLKRQNIRTIIDIGANEGQFAKRIHNLLPEAKIYSFEPLRDCYLKLVSNFKRVSKFKAFNYALGETDDNHVQMHRSQFSPSSSLLKMSELHKQEFPYTNGETIEKVSIRRLDGIAQELDIEENILIKIDVQGFEEKVIAGGTETISRAQVVITETSVERLYEGHSSFDKINDVMRQMGFRFKGCWDQLKSPIDGRVLSCDVIFMRATNLKAGVSLKGFAPGSSCQ